MVEIDIFLKKRAEEGSLRKLNPLSSRKDGRVHVGGKEYIDFSSNDYLGLAGHPKLVAAAKDALDKFGTSACASRLLTGDTDMYHYLEDEVARFKNKESALVFNSGYQANVGILACLYAKDDIIFSDRSNHASIVDGIMLSRANLSRFSHNDLNHLESLLKKERGRYKKALIVTESVFSMDGDRPDLKGIADLGDKYDCQIMVDEAHATGIYGANGSGVVEETGLSDRIDLVMGTFSKALGSFGAYLAGSKKVMEYLINACRSFIYSTSLPPSVVACNIASLELVREEAHRRERLLSISRHFRDRLKGIGFEVRGDSQIVPVIIGENAKTVSISKVLKDKGYWVMPIRPPTVPIGQARLRFSLTYHHDIDILEKVINDISNVGI